MPKKSKNDMSELEVALESDEVTSIKEERENIPSPRQQKVPKTLKDAAKKTKGMNVETDAVTISVVQLFESLQQDTRAILEQASGSERRLTDQNQRIVERIELIDKRVLTLETSAAKNSDVLHGSKVMRQLSLLSLVLILALFGNMMVNIFKPPNVQILPVTKLSDSVNK